MTKRFPYRWVVAGVLLFAYSVQYLDRVIATVLTPLFAKDIGLTTADIGTGAFLMMIFYAPAQVISGVLTDRFGAKRLLLFSIVAWSLMAGWMGLIRSPAEIFTPEVYGKAMGLVNCCGYVAAAFATKIFSALVIVKNGTKDYTPGWTFIAACAVMGIVAACFIKTSVAAEMSQAPKKPLARLDLQ